jgi:hypothetical protein
LVDIARYKRERLSDLPPAGILLLNNLEKTKWQDMEAQYSAEERNKNNTVWRNVMVAFGMDPAVPATAELFEFSRLPEHFNEPEAIRIAVLSLALAFNMDVNEIWNVLGGQMGSAKEADVQHMKAKGKGPGAFLTETERGWNDGLSLPPGIVFQYDFADAEEDQLAAQIADTKAATIRKLWEPSSATGAGIITTEEARQWLQLEGLVTDELMTQGVMADESTADDVEAAKSMIRVDDSPRCKAYSDGRVVRMERKPMAWAGSSLGDGQGQYKQALAGEARKLWSGGQSPFEFADNMFSVMRRNFTLAWRDGARIMGVKEIGDAENLRIQEFTQAQAQYLPNLIDFIQSNSKQSGGKFGDLDVRLDMWAMRWREMWNEARLFYTENEHLKWVIDPVKDHCVDCLALNGRVYSRNMWEKYGLRPQMSELACGGYLCGCRFVKTSEPFTAGHPPALIGKSHHAESFIPRHSSEASQLATVL